MKNLIYFFEFLIIIILFIIFRIIGYRAASNLVFLIGKTFGPIFRSKKTIIKNIRSLSKEFNYVFTTGGIGPTHDDITAKSIAKAFKVKYGYHKEAYKILENYYGKAKFNDGRKKMAKMPLVSKLIYNPSSAAPGFVTKNVFSLPGVPSILNSMIDNCKKYLTKGLKVHSRTVNLFTVESNISKRLATIQKNTKNL